MDLYLSFTDKRSVVIQLEFTYICVFLKRRSMMNKYEEYNKEKIVNFKLMAS